MPALRKVILFCLKIALSTLCCVFFISAQTPAASEYNLKAVFLFNFSQFTEWPASSFSSPNEPFIIGILGTDPFGSYLDETVAGEKINGHPIIIQRYGSIDKLETCQILFISQDEVNKLNSVMTKLKGKSVLTVSDGGSFIKDGGMIRLYTKQDKMHIQINQEATKSADLTVSSKLLRLAEIITPDKK